MSGVHTRKLMLYATYLSLALLLALAPRFLPQVWITVLVFANLMAVFAMSWDILSGYTGQISFGHSLFIGLGGYTSALLSIHLGLPLWTSIPLGALAALLGGLLIAFPALRLRGPYLALVTLVAPLIAIRVIMIKELRRWTGGEYGIIGVPPLSFDDTVNYYYSLGLMVSTAVLLGLLARSRIGKAFEAIRENETAAEAAGLPTAKLKVLAFVVSSSLSGLGGAFYAHYLMIAPRSLFFLDLSIEIVIAAILGGIGTITGPIAGAYFLVLVREYLRPFGIWRAVLFTLLALLFLFLLPRGFLTEARLKLKALLPLRSPRQVPEPVPPRPRTRIFRPKSTIPQGQSQGKGKADPLLELQALSKAFGGLQAVDRLSFSVREGEILGFIGPNGSGKTTVFHLIMGIYRPDRGRVFFRGREITGWPPHRVVRAGIARTFQIPQPLPHKTVAENIEIPLLGRGLNSKARFEVCCFCSAQVGLLEALKAYPDELPQAGLRRLELARALAADPELLLLDEPFAGLTRSEIRGLSRLLRELRAEGRTLVIVDHNMRGLMKLVDRLVVIHFGRKLAEGIPEEVAQNPLVQEAYLGGGGQIL